MGGETRGGQPLSAYPELRRLIDHEFNDTPRARHARWGTPWDIGTGRDHTVALRRNSVVRAALERGKSVVNLLRGIVLAWWAGEVSFYRTFLQSFRDTVPEAVQKNARRRPQPLAVYPVLQRLIVHEPWLADHEVRAQHMWEDEGWDGAHYQYFILTNEHMPALGLLMRDDVPAYLRMHFNYTLAVVDGALWAHEIHRQPTNRPLTWGGIDPKRHCTWSVRVLQRDRRWELQITQGGLIPKTYDCRTREDGVVAAERWLTDFLHPDQDNKESDDKSHRVGPTASQWLM